MDYDIAIIRIPWEAYLTYNLAISRLDHRALAILNRKTRLQSGDYSLTPNIFVAEIMFEQLFERRKYDILYEKKSSSADP